MLDRSNKVVLLIDYDNLQICASRDTPGRDLQLEPVVTLAQRYGTVIHARAYAEWNLSTERLAVYKAGIEPAFAPVLRTENDRQGKSLADTVMVAEGMDMLWTLQPQVLVLATSDKDLIPLVRVAKQRGARVVVIGSDLTAIPLREMADEHVTYKQLINDTAARLGDFQPGVPRQAPSEPVRRSRDRDRDRDRDGRDRDGRDREPRAPAPAVAAQPAGAPPAPVAAVPLTAPVAAAPVGDADGDGPGGRRRRRRGSRRRGDRVLSTGDGESGLEGEEGAAFSAASAEPLAPDSDAVAETPEILDVASEVDDMSAPALDVAERQEAAPQAAVDALEDVPPLAAISEPEVPSDNGTDGAAAPTEAEEGAEATPRRRTRRVASAARGRTRPASR